MTLPFLHGLSMGQTPVTVAQFRAFVQATGYRTDAENPAGNGPGRVGGHGWDEARRRFDGWKPEFSWKHTGWPLTDAYPVSNISWNDAVAFCRWASAVSGLHVRIPTETEWQLAERAGTATRFFSGDTAESLEGYANVADRALERKLGERRAQGEVFPFDDGYAFTSPVGAFKANAWGLYDMLGNVFAWCLTEGRPSVCGCSYNDGPHICRESARERHAEPYSRYAYFGFRVVVEVH